MASPLSFKRLRAKALTVLAAAAMTIVVTPASAHADGPAIPTFTDGFGLTQVGTPTGTATDFTITVTTPQVAGTHEIRIFLPADYAADPTKHYPVFYLLHGVGDSPNAFATFPALTAASASDSMITVVPDGGMRGWYTNWLEQDATTGAQNWETFHIDQVIPFIDANLRTIATKRGRAIGGISMGGFGALHYAERHPDLFSQVATFSGADDLAMNLVRVAVVGTEVVLPGYCAISSVSSSTGTPSCDYGPVVSSDAIFGSPYPIFNADWDWYAQSPAYHANTLSGMGISIYTGNGAPTNDLREQVAEGAAQNLESSLDTLGYPSRYVDYGNGSTWGPNCDGGHDGNCWAQDLADYLPRLEQAFA